MITLFMRVGTYPTRNFATLGCEIAERFRVRSGDGPPHVAVGIGLYLERVLQTGPMLSSVTCPNVDF